MLRKLKRSREVSGTKLDAKLYSGRLSINNKHIINILIYRYVLPYDLVVIYPVNTISAKTKIKGLLIPPLNKVITVAHIRATIDVILYVNFKFLCVLKRSVFVKVMAANPKNT